MKKKLLVPSLLAAAAVGANAAAIHTGLLNYWNMDHTGTADAVDSAGSLAGNASATVNNGTVVQPVGGGSVGYATGLFGNAASFDRGGDSRGRIEVADPAGSLNDVARAGGAISLSMWVKYDDAQTSWQALIGHGEGADYRVAREGTNNWNLGSVVGGSNNDIKTSDAPALTDTNGLNNNTTAGLNGWHHILVTSGGANSDKKIYFDGLLEGEKLNDAGAIADTQDFLYIGNNAGSDQRQWDGLIDDFGMWDRPLTAAEVTTIYNAGVVGTSLGSIPEPGVSILAGLAGLGLMFRRRK